jgi:hypothetical protein
MDLDSGLAAFGFQQREYVRNHPVVYASNHLVRIIQPLERILQFTHLRFSGGEVPNQFPSRVARLSHFYADVLHALRYTGAQEDRESGNPIAGVLMVHVKHRNKHRAQRRAETAGSHSIPLPSLFFVCCAQLVGKATATLARAAASYLAFRDSEWPLRNWKLESVNDGFWPI